MFLVLSEVEAFDYRLHAISGQSVWILKQGECWFLAFL